MRGSTWALRRQALFFVLAAGATLSLATTSAAVSTPQSATIGPVARAAKSDQKKGSSKKSSPKQREADDGSSKSLTWGDPGGKTKYKKNKNAAATIRQTIRR